MGYRKVLDKESQEAVIAEVRLLTYDLNPRIWLGIKWLSTYISIRPAEMISLKEGEIDRKTGHFFIPNPKENRFKVIPMLPEDIELARSFPLGLPDLPFFRHTKGGSGCCPGQAFGQKYFYKWWKSVGIWVLIVWICMAGRNIAPLRLFVLSSALNRFSAGPRSARIKPFSGIYR